MGVETLCLTHMEASWKNKAKNDLCEIGCCLLATPGMTEDLSIAKAHGWTEG